MSVNYRGIILFLIIPILALLGGCANTPIPDSALDRDLSAKPAARPPRPNNTFTDSVLACVGNKLRDGRIAPIIIGYQAQDKSGKVGLDIGTLTRDSLAKIVNRGAAVRVTSTPQSEFSLQHLDFAHRVLLQKQVGIQLLPDLVIDIAVSSVVANGKTYQNSGGISAQQLDAIFSKSNSVEEIRLSFHLRNYSDGTDVPGGNIAMKMVHQSYGYSAELGVFLQTKIKSKNLATGLRFAKGEEFIEAPEDAVRAGVEVGVTFLIAERYNLNLDNCGESFTIADQRNYSEMYDKFSQQERVQWIQKQLAELGYDPGKINGKNGQKSNGAIQQFERDNKLTPSNGVVNIHLFLALAKSKFNNQDGIKFILSEQFEPYEINDPFQAHIVVPRAGWLTCYYQAPGRWPVSIFPFYQGRPNYVTANSPLPLLSDIGAKPGHLTLILSEKGEHGLFCIETEGDIATRLPLPLQPGEEAKGFTLSLIRDKLRTLAGADRIADGATKFNVVMPIKKSQGGNHGKG
jgi:hypothetical protein